MKGMNNIKRPILVIVIGYILGILMGLYFKYSIVLLYFLITIIYYLCKRHKSINNQKRKFKLISFKRYFRYVKLLFSQKVILLIIISSVISNTMVIIKNTNFEELYIKEQGLTIKGIVVSDKTEKEYSDTYKIKVNKCDEVLKYKNKYLYIKIGKKLKVTLDYGDEIIIKGKYIEPNTKRNYGGFDYKQYLKTNNIYGSVNVENIKINNKKKANVLFYLANKLACKIEKTIDDNLEKNEASLLKGILIGKTSDIEEETYKNFRVANISHILAVSGMHVSYIIIGCNILFEKSIGKRKSKYIIIAILIIYMFVTGFSPSIVRATIMGILFMISKIVYRKNDVWTSISLSLLIILVFNPYIIMDIGLQLSYIGTIGIILLQRIVQDVLKNIKFRDKKKVYKINRKKILFISKIQEILSVTISAQLVILPFMLYHFNLFGTYFFISNLLISLIIGPIIIIGFSVIIFSCVFYPVGKIVFILLEIMIKILIQISQIGNLPFSKIYFSTPKIWIIVIYYIFVSLFILIYPIYTKRKISITQQRFKNIISLIKYKFKESNKKSIKIFLIVFFIVVFLIYVFPKNLKINFVDVGQGDCTFVITPRNKTILIDGGGSKSSDFDVGKSTLFPYILDRGYTKIDYIIISHFDEDHCGGLFYIIQELKVKNIIIGKQNEVSTNYSEFIKTAQNKKINIKVVEGKTKIDIEPNIYFDILWPYSNTMISEDAINNNSLVCKLNYKKFSMLFTGDIEEIAEKEILYKYSKNLGVLKSDILKVGHHGSKTSSSNEFIKEISPKYVVIGVGKNNKFGHPNNGVLERLNNYGTKIYRTDEDGEISIIVNRKGKVKIKKFINM